MLDLKEAKPTDHFWHHCFQAYAHDIEEHAKDMTNAYGKKCKLVDRLQTLEDKEFCVYVIGPMSQKPFLNIAEFYTVKQMLEKLDIKVVLPHDVVDKNTPWLDAVTQSLQVMNECTLVCSLRDDAGVSESMGSSIEHIACYGADIMCIPYDKMLEFIAYCVNKAADEVDYM